KDLLVLDLNIKQKINKKTILIFIYNIQGKLIYNKKINSNNLVEYNASDLSNGIYFYKIVNNHKTYSGKLVKQ
ncbi:MAG: T9SS type A sorting domain-containing protein, partial [Bacteroidota bacterium]|nr:T9SS type A sorting domain-containing protein [Bacteroidota bacterium]